MLRDAVLLRHIAAFWGMLRRKLRTTPQRNASGMSEPLESVFACVNVFISARITRLLSHLLFVAGSQFLLDTQGAARSLCDG